MKGVAYGFFFAVLQYWEFLLLNLFFSSAVITFIGVTVAWLAGSATGFLVGRAFGWPVQIGMQLAAFGTLATVLAGAPVADSLVPLYFLCVATTAVGVGHFFRRFRTRFDSVSSLLWHENDGFVLGIPTVFGTYLVAGRTGVYGLVAIAALVAAVLERRAD